MMTSEEVIKFVEDNYERDENSFFSEKKRAAVYVRYSSENQRDGYSVEYQIAECQKYISQNDMLFVKAYVDEATTGKTTNNRTAFFEMLADVKRGLYDCVIVYKYSRFARNLVEATIYRQQIEKAGVRLISAMEQIDDSTPEGKMMRNIIMVMDEYYSENLAVFVQSSMYTAAKQGKPLGGVAPFGYRIDDEKKLTIVKSEAKVIENMFNLYASGFSLADILRWTNSQGIRTRRGNQFSESGLYTILRNEKYIGRFVYEVKGYDSIIIDHAHPRIVDDETWNRVQERISTCLENKHQPKPRLRKRVYPLTGKITCGCCGNSFIGNAKTDSRRPGQEYNYYSCRGKKRFRTCKMKDIRKEYLEEYVFSEIKERLLNPAIIDKIARQTYENCSGGADDLHEEIKSLKAQRAKIERKLENLLDAMLDGDMPKSVMNKKSATLKGELSDIQKQLDKKQVEASATVTYEMIRDFLLQLMNDLEKGDEELKKAVAEQMVQSITIYDERVDVIIGVNYRYFFRDTQENGSPNISLSRKREDIVKHCRRRDAIRKSVVSKLKHKLLQEDENTRNEHLEILENIINTAEEYAK